MIHDEITSHKVADANHLVACSVTCWLELYEGVISHGTTSKQ